MKKLSFYFLTLSLVSSIFAANNVSKYDTSKNMVAQINISKQISDIDSDSEDMLEDSILTVSKRTLIKHAAHNYKNVSLRKKREILSELFKMSKEYNINPIILYSIVDVESKMQYWIKHSIVKVRAPVDENKTKFRTVTTNAIGLGGVIWEIWKYDLQREGIAEVKSDLYDPKINIRAIAYIFDYYRKQPLLKGVKSKTQSALLRYYGIVLNKDGSINQTYFRKISNSIYNIIQYELFKN